VRRPGARPIALAALAGAVVLATLLPPVRDGLKEAGNKVLGFPALRRRAAAASEEPPFSRLAASQVGYAPSMRKQFSSPRTFASFEVLNERDGSVVFRGGPPVRAIATEVLGAIRTVWVGDFTPLDAPGRYRIAADNGLSSHPFGVGANVFDDAVRAVQRAFYFQRAFTAIHPPHAEGPWIHASDADRAPPGEAKGWHDAGDFSIYNASATTALFWLLEAYSDFAPAADNTNVPESGNGVPDLLDEARWELEWMLSVQEPSGGFRNTTCQERYGPYGTNLPDRVPPYRPGEAGTMATGRAAGTLAYASVVFRAHDPIFAERCLEAAFRGYRYLEAHPHESTDGPTCPAMRQDGDAQLGRGMRMYAAAGMLLATSERRFRDDFEENYEEIRSDPSYQRTNAYAALLYLRAAAGDAERKREIRERLRLHADLARSDGDRHPFQWATRYLWGSIGAAFQRTGAFSAKVCLEAPQRARADCEQVLANVHYALGRNYLHFSYVSGLRGVSHGRTHAFHQWLAALDAKPFVFPGLVAGGPSESPQPNDVSFPRARPIPIWGYWGDPAMPRDRSTPLEGRYTDNDSWSTNELDVEWQAATLYSLYFAQRWSRGSGER
jgi:endoglucanase